MSKQKLSVVVTRRLPETVETRLCELFDATLREDDTPMSLELEDQDMLDCMLEQTGGCL